MFILLIQCKHTEVINKSEASNEVSYQDTCYRKTIKQLSLECGAMLPIIDSIAQIANLSFREKINLGCDVVSDNEFVTKIKSKPNCMFLNITFYPFNEKPFFCRMKSNKNFYWSSLIDTCVVEELLLDNDNEIQYFSNETEIDIEDDIVLYNGYHFISWYRKNESYVKIEGDIKNYSYSRLDSVFENN